MWAAGILLLVGLLISFVPWQRKIQKTYDGIQSRIGHTDYAQQLTVTVDGVHKSRLIGISEPVGAASKSWQAEAGLFIALPASDRTQALVLAQELAQAIDIQGLAPLQGR